MKRHWLLVAALGAGLLTTTAPAAAADDLPTLSPAPQSIRRLGSDLSGLTVVKETGTASARAAGALSAWSLPSAAGLKPGGYVLGIGSYQGEKLAVLVGHDAAGTFYGEQTLAQLTKAGSVPSVAIVDEPAFALRGGMESFYGQPWQQADLLNHLDFLGRHRMNAFQYTVSGDPHTAGAEWRTRYTGADVERMRGAIERAKANQVEFIYRINPEANASPEIAKQFGICHIRQADKDALIARYQQLWDLGERTFSIGWDDVGGEFRCPEDERAFGSDASPLGAAQAHVVNDVYDRFVKTHPGARLLTVPTDYWGTGTTPYRTRFAALIPTDVDIFWTGREVVSPTITTDDAAAASAAFGGRKLLIFDNYPVNDYTPTAQHLGPLVGRDAGLPQYATGFLINEMQEAEPSLIALGTAAEYAWNPTAYQPQAAWQRILTELGGPAADALRRYAEVHTGSVLTADSSAPLTPHVRAFIEAYRAGRDLTAPAAALTDYLARLGAAPAELRAGLGNPSFLRDSEPWLARTERRSRAGIAAVRALQAKAAGDLTGYRARRDEIYAALNDANTSFRLAVPGTLDDLLDLAGVARGTDVVRHDNGAMSVFERNRNGMIQSTSQRTAGSTWDPFVNLWPVDAAGKPEVVVRRDGGLTAFVRHADGRIRTSRQTGPGGDWGAWEIVLDLVVGGDPAAVVGDDGLISLFVRGTDGVPVTIWQRDGGWRSEKIGGTTMVGKPAVDVSLDGLMVMVVRDTNNKLQNSWQPSIGSAWVPWKELPGSIGSDPDLVMSYSGAFSVFYRTPENAVSTTWQPSRGAAFTGLARLGGITAQGSPRVTLDNTGGLSLSVRGSDNRGWVMWQLTPGGNWQDGKLNGEQVAHSDVRNTDSVGGAGVTFTIDADGKLRTSWQSALGSGWSGWADLGGSLS
ncbi:beta-N-acetylglucosaminidase domain-containing protein [Kribbella sp. NPDC056951]|uniref:beta-N-acetylglucosaminidase domain-containing protein n=1 Tax=Kribbella sp. NPDC056951 TaxID=3345978 RepID=UPI00362F9C4C